MSARAATPGNGLAFAALAAGSLVALALAIGLSVGIGDLPIPLSTTSLP